MKNAKIVLVAQWDGWCGACADDRPLVLTRTGRQRLRTWLTGAADDSRPLLLTCRLCGTGVDVPLELDDPPLAPVHEPEPVPALSAEASAPTLVGPAVEPAVEPALVPAAGAAGASPAELTAGRQTVASALGALLASRAVGQAPAPALAVTVAAPGTVPVLAPAATLPLPLQRTAASAGLAELQLLADGIDLLSSSRA